MVFIITVAAKVQQNLVHQDPAKIWVLTPNVNVMVAIVMLHVVMFWAAWRRGMAVGLGNRIAGFSLGPMRHGWLLLLLALLLFPLVGSWVLFLKNIIHLPMPEQVANLMAAQTAHFGIVEIVTLLNLALVAPVVEEIWFRGWLWNGLRRSWGVLPVALTTSVFWILLHAPEGLTKLLVLLPIAILLCLLRHVCGSTRATIALHMLNNLAPVAVLIAHSG